MALDTLTSMMVFRKIVEQGSIVAAARSCGLSAEMAGHHLRALEARLGVLLITRTTRSLNATDPGLAYYKRCVAALDEIALAEAEAAQQQSVPSGRLKVAAPLAFGRHLMAGPISAYMSLYPDVSIELDLSERHVRIVEEGYDIAVRLGDLPDSGLIARNLAEFPLLAVASERYSRENARIASPEDLKKHEVLIYSQTPHPREWQFWHPSGRREKVSVNGRITASDVEFLLKLAIEDRGVLLAPSFLLSEALHKGLLVRLLDGWSTRSLPLRLVVPNRTLMPATTRSFMDHLVSWFSRAAS